MIIKKYLLKFIGRFFPSILYSKKYYGQNGEDAILEAILNVKKGYKGFYVDVGAHHPFRFSNTAIFYNKGWRGINIEPTPDLIAAFNRHRPMDINLNIGIGTVEQSLTFYQFDEPALNSFDQELSEYRHQNTNYRIVNSIVIPILPLSYVFSKHLKNDQIIDFISIDVEGLDLIVLQSNNWDLYRPKFILIEVDRNPNSATKDNITNYLSNQHYKLVSLANYTAIFQDCK